MLQRFHALVQESMETKTDMEPDIVLTVQPTMTVGEVQKQVEKKMGWLPTNKLKRCAWHPPPQCLFSDCPGRCVGRVVGSYGGKHIQHFLGQQKSFARSLPFTAAIHKSLGLFNQVHPVYVEKPMLASSAQPAYC